MRRVTINDIAKLAGVSKVTVSAVINNRSGVGEATRKRILQLIDDFNYTPNDLARGLALQQTATWGLVVKDITNPYYAQIAKGVEHVAHAHDFGVLLCTTEEDHVKETAAIEMLKRKRVDGLILAPFQENVDLSHLFALKQESYPFVLISYPIQGFDAHYIYSDDVGGVTQAVDHLVSLGHRNIAYFAGLSSNRFNSARLEGYQKALAAAGISYDDRLVIQAGTGISGGQKALWRFLELGHAKPTAVICYNDMMAIGVLMACAELGIRVPEDLSIIGFDNIDVAQVLNPPLTTVHIPQYQLGLSAATILFNLNSGTQPSKYQHLALDTQLVVRSSTAECPVKSTDDGY